MNSNGTPITTSPNTTPTSDSGTTDHITRGCRSALNRKITTSTIAPKPNGIALIKLPFASAELPSSPSHFRL